MELLFRQILQFELHNASGHFELSKNASEGHGLIVCNGYSFAASILVPPLTYELDVALGAAYVSTESGGLQLVYDENSQMWADSWKTQKQEKAFKLTYQLDSSSTVGQQIMTLTMQFEAANEEHLYRYNGYQTICGYPKSIPRQENHSPVDGQSA